MFGIKISQFCERIRNIVKIGYISPTAHYWKNHKTNLCNSMPDWYDGSHLTVCKNASVMKVLMWIFVCLFGLSCLYTDYNTREPTDLRANTDGQLLKDTHVLFLHRLTYRGPCNYNRILPLYDLIKLPVQTSLQLQQ